MALRDTQVVAEAVIKSETIRTTEVAVEVAIGPAKIRATQVAVEVAHVYQAKGYSMAVWVGL